MKTSLVPIESSLHGRERRAQRDISKVDLQAAVLYGTKEAGRPHPHTGELRWKYTYAGVTFITDSTSTVEITSWSDELPLVEVNPVPLNIHAQYEEAKKRILEDPSLITSHSVIVVDMSASMKKADMNGHRSRARGVYYTLAEELLAAQLHPIEAGVAFGPRKSFSDVITLIEFHSTPIVVCSKEPYSWLPYNAFVRRADAPDARDHGCYKPAIDLAFRMLRESRATNKCALQIFFFTDGKPSDAAVSKKAFPDKLYDSITRNCAIYGQRLTFTLCGFGSVYHDFEVLRGMEEAAKAGGAKTMFGLAAQNADMLRQMIYSSQLSLTDTATKLSRLKDASDLSSVISGTQHHMMGKSRDVVAMLRPESLAYLSVNGMNYEIFLEAEYVIRRQEFIFVETEQGQWKGQLMDVKYESSDAVGFEVSRYPFAQGAERLAYLMTELNPSLCSVGHEKVAKTSKKFVRNWHNSKLAQDLRSYSTYCT